MIDAADKNFLTGLFDAAVRAADPEATLARALPDRPTGRTVVIGAAQLGAAFEMLWEDSVEGLIVTRYGYGARCRQLKVLEAAQRVPDSAGLAASRAVLDAVRGLTEGDLVVALICGGSSALLPAPPEGLTLEDELALNAALLASGALIGAMNAICKQVSLIKGGRFAAAAYPAPVVSLDVSDVPGDNPAEVASGPTVPDIRERALAKRLIETYRISMPAKVAQFLDAAPDDAHAPKTRCSSAMKCGSSPRRRNRSTRLRRQRGPREFPRSFCRTRWKVKRAGSAGFMPPSLARSRCETAPSRSPL